MNTSKRILAIIGSTKKASSNKTIIHTLAALYKDQVIVDVYDSIDQLPHFNPDLDTATHLPTAVQDLRSRIAQADGMIICTPEYVFSLPGSLKNAIEWNVSTTLFSNKPTALIVAAASGEKAFESLQLIMTTVEAKIAPASKVLLQGMKGKINAQGEIVDSNTIRILHTVMDSLVQSI